MKIRQKSMFVTEDLFSKADFLSGYIEKRSKLAIAVHKYLGCTGFGSLKLN